MKITLCIPCVDKHIPLLINLLKTIPKFSRKPDNIMIGLSPKFNSIDLNNEKEKLFSLFPDLPLTIIVQNKKTHAAEHLNNMGKLINEGFIVRADADDVIHPQKLEVIEKILEKYPDTKLILHRWYFSQKRDYSMTKFSYINDYSFKNEIFTDIKCENLIISENFSKKYKREPDFLSKSNWIVNGANSYSFSVFKDVLYKNISFAEDTIFNRDVTRKYNKTIFLDIKLIDIISSGTWRN